MEEWNTAFTGVPEHAQVTDLPVQHSRLTTTHPENRFEKKCQRILDIFHPDGCYSSKWWTNSILMPIFLGEMLDVRCT